MTGQSGPGILQGLLGASRAAVFVCAPDGHVVYNNEAALAAFDYAESEFLERTLDELLPSVVSEQVDACRSHLMKTSSGRLLVTSVSLQHIERDDGTWTLVIVNPANGAVPGATRDGFPAWRQLALAEIGNRLAHEMNQPLTAVTLHCDAAASTAGIIPGDHQDLLADLEEASQQAFRASSIISRFRQDYRDSIAEREATDVNRLVIEAAQNAAPDTPSVGAGIEMNLSDELPLVALARTLMLHALVGLINLAKDAVTDDKSYGLVVLRTRYDEGQVSIDVIAPAIRFEQTDPTFQPLAGGAAGWAGLDYAVCRRIIAAHNGNLSTRAAGGFRVSLPAAAGDPS